tara:strand:+ start:1496 stop:3826 length:2331 start_codon:yes stop_codon:yes gene_type:complete
MQVASAKDRRLVSFGNQDLGLVTSADAPPCFSALCAPSSGCATPLKETIMGKQPIQIPNPPNVSCGIGVGFKQQMFRSLGVVYAEIRNPPESTVEKIEQIRELVETGKFQEANRLKKELLAFCWSGKFENRKNAGLIEHSGRLQIDLDKLGTPEQIQAIKQKLQSVPQIEAVFLSPSGNGLKVGLRIPKAANDEEHLQSFQAAERFFKEEHGLTIDPQCKDVCRMCFMSHDLDAYFNPDASVLDVHKWKPDQPPDAQKPTSPAKPQPQRKTAGKSKERKHAEAVLETAAQKIQQAPDGEKHNTRLNHSRLVGGFAASGSLDVQLALSKLIAAALSNTENPTQAEKDVRDGFADGTQHPIDMSLPKGKQETPNQRASPDSPDSMFAQTIDFDKADWHKRYISEDKQVLIANIHNVKEYLRQTRAEIWFDNFLHKTLNKLETGEILEWDDHRTLVLTVKLQNIDEGLQRISTKLVHEGVMLYSGVHRRNVLTDWLDSLEWDGQFRLDDWLSVYCGAKDSVFVREAGRCWLLAAVARAYHPGTKFDHVLILEGEQGIGKSSVFAVLANGWSDELNTFGGKEATEKLDGVWIIEIAELAAMRRSDVETMKSFITATHDRYRPAYGRNVVEKPRSCVFGGTTNSKDYLPDPTGNRRFWPIHCEAINVSGLRQDRDQLWAEAVVRHQRGESFLLSEEARTEAVEEQEERYQMDAWEEDVRKYLKDHDAVTTAEILQDALSIDNKGQWKRGDEMRVGSILRHMGFKKRLERNGEERRPVYRKG